jgi:hypothetical protein
MMRQNSASVYCAGRVSAALAENATTPTITTTAAIIKFFSIGIQKRMILAWFQIRKLQRVRISQIVPNDFLSLAVIDRKGSINATMP